MTCRQHGTGQGSAKRVEKEKRSSREIVRVALPVKDWEKGPPDVEAVRPGKCPGCGAASRPVGGRVVLHGHGKRSRQVLGPQEPGGTPRQVEVQVRRYHCQACGATCTVAPWEVWTRRLYSLAAIAWALALWGVVGLGLAAVRGRVSPWVHVGATSARRWRTPLAWVEAVQARRLFGRVRPWPAGWKARRAAAHVASAVAGHAPPSAPSPPLAVQTFRGAVHAA